MDSKVKHRILGVIVLAGIAIIAYPFLQKTSGIPDEKSLSEAPPFPDQAIQVSLTDSEESATKNNTDAKSNTGTSSSDEEQPDGAINLDSSVVIDIEAPPLINPAELKDSAKNLKPDEETTQNQAANNDDEKQVKPDENSKESTDGAAAGDTDDDGVTETRFSQKKKPAAKTAAKPLKQQSSNQKSSKPVIYSRLGNKEAISSYQNRPLDENGLIKMKNAAWVIQLGSFKEKANALRLVNKLRSRGYRAFIQGYSAASGEHTRVFVGPEPKQKNARLVASEIQKEMKMQGIVISYKPFTL